jgi:formamidopyrimidine-DNA glycosylase
MIEYPEAVTLARQLCEAVTGRSVVAVERGNAPHKFAFYSGTPEWYAETLTGQRLGRAIAHGSLIMVPVGAERVLVLGGGGERITHHPKGEGIPARRHLRLDFDDGSALSVTVQGWGELRLFTFAEAYENRYIGPPRIAPTSDEYSLESFLHLFDSLEIGDACLVKRFVISEPGIWGVGNGYLQDILFCAGIHPRRRAALLSPEERTRLHASAKQVLTLAVSLDGRDTERDLYGRPGRYVRKMDSRTVGLPCPRCGSPIQKLSLLGGVCYVCPKCQPSC